MALLLIGDTGGGGTVEAEACRSGVARELCVGVCNELAGLSR